MKAVKYPRRMYAGNPRRLKFPKGWLHQCAWCWTWMVDPEKKDLYLCSRRCKGEHPGE